MDYGNLPSRPFSGVVILCRYKEVSGGRELICLNTPPTDILEDGSEDGRDWACSATPPDARWSPHTPGAAMEAQHPQTPLDTVAGNREDGIAAFFLFIFCFSTII